jgi:hypothetical protein
MNVIATRASGVGCTFKAGVRLAVSPSKKNRSIAAMTIAAATAKAMLCNACRFARAR